MAPLAGHRVIPPGWAAHHRPVAESVMTATCTIRRRDSSSANDSAGWSPTGGRAARGAVPGLWSGPCRVQAQASAVAQAELAGQEVTTRTYAVGLPLGVPALRVGAQGDTVVIDTCPDDPQLVGKRLRIIDLTSGSLLWQRDVVATLDLTAA